MVGICGTVSCDLTEEFSEGLQGWGDEIIHQYKGENTRISISRHEFYDGDQPAENEKVRLWVWGSIVGYDGPNGYRSRCETHPDATDPEYCLKLYEQYGPNFVENLNSEFVIVIQNLSENTVKICTDRLGSRPIFYNQTNKGEFIFSSRLQSLLRHPDIETEFDRHYLYEYFSFERVIGTQTPLKNIEQLLPASKTTINISTGEKETEVYWHPEYRPLDKPYSYFVQEFVDRFEGAIYDRTSENVEYGLLLSGGIDSRTILAAMDSPITGYHMNEWRNEEEKTARKIASITGQNYKFLQRDKQYMERALNRNPPQMDFISSFDQGHATNFQEEIFNKTDVLMSGLYSDVLYQGNYLPVMNIDVPIIGEDISIPIKENNSGVNDYLQLLLSGHYTRPEKSIPSPYFESDIPLKRILEKEISSQSAGITNHGVTYPGLTELINYSYYYPLTNAWSYFFHQSLIQMGPYRNPFLDIRLIDLQHRLPSKYHSRTNIVNDALCELSPRLGDIPHANKGVAPAHPFFVRHFGSYAYKFAKRYLGRENEPSESYHTTGSWVDDKQLIRITDFIPRILIQHKKEIQDCEWLSWDAVWETYSRHMRGENNRAELFTLATVLNMSISEIETRRNDSQ